MDQIPFFPSLLPVIHPPPPQLLHWPACINACMLHMGLFVQAHVSVCVCVCACARARARACVCVCACVCEYVLGNKWMDNFILCISMLSVFLLLYTPWAVKLVLIGMVLTNFHYYYVSLYNTDMKRMEKRKRVKKNMKTFLQSLFYCDLLLCCRREEPTERHAEVQWGVLGKILVCFFLCNPV